MSTCSTTVLHCELEESSCGRWRPQEHRSDGDCFLARWPSPENYHNLSWQYVYLFHWAGFTKPSASLHFNLDYEVWINATGTENVSMFDERHQKIVAFRMRVRLWSLMKSTTCHLRCVASKLRLITDRLGEFFENIAYFLPPQVERNWFVNTIFINLSMGCPSLVATSLAAKDKTDWQLHSSRFVPLLLPHLRNFKTAFKDLSHVFRCGGAANSHGRGWPIASFPIGWYWKLSRYNHGCSKR